MIGGEERWGEGRRDEMRGGGGIRGEDRRGREEK